jgi:hypothetical protein
MPTRRRVDPVGLDPAMMIGPPYFPFFGWHTESHSSGGIECPGKSGAVQCGANH